MPVVPPARAGGGAASDGWGGKLLAAAAVRGALSSHKALPLGHPWVFEVLVKDTPQLFSAWVEVIRDVEELWNRVVYLQLVIVAVLPFAQEREFKNGPKVCRKAIMIGERREVAATP